MTHKPILQTHSLSIGYKQHPVSDNISAKLYAGELVCLIGPNGAGKTTLMRTLAGMLAPLSGHVTILGDDVNEMPARTLAQQLSVVLTDRVDVGLLSGYALVALGRHPYTDWTGNLSKEDEHMIRWAVNAVGAQSIAERNVSELSDGERQKLLIARALAQDPAVMILDEPTAYLDLPRRVEIMQLLRNLGRETERAILLSTHDLDLALRNADRIWLMPKQAPMVVGAPEDLVLDGSFEKAFASEGVQFDKRTGSFRPYAEQGDVVQVIGDGVDAIWTRRALERVGYQIVDTADIIVTVGDRHWQLSHNGSVAGRYPRLYDLLDMLRCISTL